MSAISGGAFLTSVFITNCPSFNEMIVETDLRWSSNLIVCPRSADYFLIAHHHVIGFQKYMDECIKKVVK